MELTETHRRFLRRDQFAHAFVINVALNALIAWAILRGHPTLPLWGETAIGPDLLATGVLLPLLTCVIVSRVIRGQVASGKLPPLPPEQILQTGMHRRSVWLRGAVLALFATICGSLPLVALLSLANAGPVSLGAFVGFKALWCGVLAAMVSPPLAWWALSAASLEHAHADA